MPMDHSLFISFSSHDEEHARRVCDYLEGAGHPCWISLRDVQPGDNYQATIVRAIQAAKVFILMLSHHTNESGEIHKELSLASACKAAVIPLRIVDVQPQGALLYELATCQWIDAAEEWDTAMQQLVGAVERRLGGPPADAPMARSVRLDAPPSGPVPDADQAPPAPPPPQMPKAPTAPVISVEAAEAAKAALAFYLGPIAAVVVRKATARATSLSDFHQRVAEHIEAPLERDEFRRRLKNAR